MVLEKNVLYIIRLIGNFFAFCQIDFLQLFDRCGPEDYMMDLCDYQNKTFSSDKVDDNYHTGELGQGVHVSEF